MICGARGPCVSRRDTLRTVLQEACNAAREKKTIFMWIFGEIFAVL